MDIKQITERVRALLKDESLYTADDYDVVERRAMSFAETGLTTDHLHSLIDRLGKYEKMLAGAASIHLGDRRVSMCSDGLFRTKFELSDDDDLFYLYPGYPTALEAYEALQENKNEMVLD